MIKKCAICGQEIEQVGEYYLHKRIQFVSPIEPGHAAMPKEQGDFQDLEDEDRWRCY